MSIGIFTRGQSIFCSYLESKFMLNTCYQNLSLSLQILASFSKAKVGLVGDKYSLLFSFPHEINIFFLQTFWQQGLSPYVYMEP